MMTREEHLESCKQRARAYLDKGDVKNAVASMMSDLNKHPETAIGGILATLGLHAAMTGDLAEARRYIEGFN
jgi:uncharacterized membrane-anchored protein